MYSEPSIGGQTLLQETLADLARRTRFPIVFGGFSRGDSVVVTHLVGNRKDTLRGLVVRNGWGLGGRVLQEGRPRLTSDYGTSRVITHDYDQPVLAEGITTMFALPVAVGGSVRAVLYGALRTAGSIGGVSLDPAVSVAQEFAARLAQLDAPRATPSPGEAPAHPRGLDAAPLEELRRVYADLRTIAAGIDDPSVRARLELLEHRLADIAAGGTAPVEPDDEVRRPTSRESDALSLAALGYTNAAIGETMGVTEATVKSYMNSAMRKLGATTRFEAVAVARRLRLLP